MTHRTYHAEYSASDAAWIGTCDQYKWLSCAAPSLRAALAMVMRVVGVMDRR